MATYQSELQRGRVFQECLEEVHSTLSFKFEGMVRNAPTPPRRLAAQTVTHVLLAVRGVDALSTAGQNTMAFGNLRVVEEATSNLLYILYGGPAKEGRTADDLASQFFAFRARDHWRAISKNREEFEAKMRAGWSPSDGNFPNGLADFLPFCDNVKKQSDEAKKNYPRMTDSSWHNINKEDRTQAILDNAPPFVNEHDVGVLQITHTSTFLFNTILHGGPMMFDEDLGKVPCGRLFETKNDQGDVDWAVVAARLGYLCWRALGDVCGDLALVEETWKKAEIGLIKRIAVKSGLPV